MYAHKRSAESRTASQEGSYPALSSASRLAHTILLLEPSCKSWFLASLLILSLILALIFIVHGGLRCFGVCGSTERLGMVWYDAKIIYRFNIGRL